MNRFLMVAMVVAMGCNTPARNRSACRSSESCKAGQICGDQGICTEPCSRAAECIAGEQCMPSPEAAGTGQRYCVTPCGKVEDGKAGPDQSVCDAKSALYGASRCCLTRWSGGGEQAQGWVCNDEMMGQCGGDTDGAADESGG